jgi:peptidyl-prolyl cis-trans isomerase B (cyclophilin B)
MNVVDKIVAVKTDSTDTPLKPIPLKVNVIKMSKNELIRKGYTGFSAK